jgi:Spy/CpxP family protein refolding chaperone
VRLQTITMIAAAALSLAGSAIAQAQAAAPPAAPLATPPAAEQRGISSQDIDLMRKDIRSQKKQLIAQNLRLTDTEATKFWPIYDQYTADLVKVNNKKYKALQDYAEKFGSLSDEQAQSLAKQALEVDGVAAQLRLKYLPIFAQAVGGKQAATFSQLDRRISMLIDLQLASRLPLVQSQGP